MLYEGIAGSHPIGSEEDIHGGKQSDTVITRTQSDTRNAASTDVHVAVSQ